MKKFSLGALALGALFLGSCSNDGDIVASNGEVETSYLSVNLVTNFAGTGSKAESDQYEDGIKGENIVNNVRFYFFDATGQPSNAKVQNGTAVNFTDWTASSDNNYGLDEDNNITNHINATVVIEHLVDNSKDAATPSSVIALINMPSDWTAAHTASMTKEDLEKEVGSYVAYTNTAAGAENFVMSNSVYADQAASPAAKLVEVSTDGHLYPTPEAAKGNPVTIYVERVLAKVQLSIASPSDNDVEAGKLIPVEGKQNVFDTGKTYTEGGVEKKIYVKFLNWNVTATPDKSYLIKNIDPTWQNVLGSDIVEPWNDPTRHRSYWAINPKQFAYKHISYNDIDPNYSAGTSTGLTAVSFDENTVRYPHENAAKDAAGSVDFIPSKVIIGAQLVKEDGETPLTYAEYGFDKYINLDDLKKALLSLLTTKYYLEADGAGNDVVAAGSKNYRQIGINDVEFVTERSLLPAPSDDADKTSCYTRIQLKKTNGEYPALYTISTVDGEKKATAANGADIDSALKALGRQKIWQGGATYYYFDIHHLGYGSTEETPLLGVVRNHVYKARITAVVGLGSPVYDPDEEIIPQRPSQDDTYVAAEIKVLSWRLVNWNVGLEW